MAYRARRSFEWDPAKNAADIAVGPAHGELVVVICTDPEEDVIRIISARSATRREQQLYWHHPGQTNGR